MNKLKKPVETRGHSAAHQAPGSDAVVTVDGQGRIILFNAGAEELFGCMAAEAVGLPLEHFVVDRSRTADQRFFERYVSRASPILIPDTAEIFGRRADGREFPAETAVARLEVSGEPVYAILFRDITERIESGAAARLVASIVTSSSDAIASKNLEGVVTSWNAGAERMFGYSAGEMIGQPITRIIPPDRLMDEDMILSSIALGERVEHFETERLHKDGHAVAVSVTISPVRDANGEIVGASKVARDITERRRLDASLREARDTLRLLIEQAPVNIAMFDRDMRYVAVSRRWVSEFGRGYPDLVGRSHYEVAPVAATRRDLHQRAMSGEVLHSDEDEVVLENGQPRWFRWAMHPWRDAQGQIGGIVTFAEDITERRLAEARVRESDAQFRNLAESLPQLIWACDAHGNCDFLSSQWLHYTGKPAIEQLGRGWMESIHPADRAALAESWEQAVRSGSEFRLEFRICRRDGEYRWFESRGRPQKDETGKLTRWFGANTDIEDRRNAEEARMRVQKLEALGTLASGIAHDFNNILLAIRGNVSMALEEQPEGVSLTPYLQEIDKASRRAVDLVRRILTFSKQDDPVQKKIFLQQLAEEVRALMRATLPAQLELQFSADPSAPPVLADASQIHQVLLNLLTNAAHAIGPRAGTIGLSVDRVMKDGEYVRVAVTDTGIGMTQATLARIFDPFFTTKPPGQGTGLGLSIVDGIMKQHHGVIAVTSEVGRGSRFELYFPASARDDGEVAESKSGAAVLARGEQVLYVDDDSSLVLLVSRKLTRLGYSVQGVTDPREALDLIRAQPERFDAVVTDLSMPGIPGLELAQEILKIRPGLPIVVTSGFVTEADETRAREIGIRAFILKPQTIDELGDTLAGLLSGSD